MDKVLWLFLTLPVFVSHIFVGFLVKLLVQSMQEFFPATKCQATKAYGSRFFVAFNPISSASKLTPNRSRLLPSLNVYFHRSQIFLGPVAQSV